VAARRAERSALWQDSACFQYSFCAPDSRQDSTGNTEFGGLTSNSGSGRRSSRSSDEPSDDVGGVVVDIPLYGTRTRH